MAKFLVEAAADTEPKRDVKAMIVDAVDAAGARDLAAARFDGDGCWANATVTALAAPAVANYAGFKYRIRVGGPELPLFLGGASRDELLLEYTAPAGSTMDNIGDALAAALVARGGHFVGAAYVGGTNTLTVAALAAGIGDRTLIVEVFPTGCQQPLAAMVGAITHRGVAAAALTVVLGELAAIPCVQKIIR